MAIQLVFKLPVSPRRGQVNTFDHLPRQGRRQQGLEPHPARDGGQRARGQQAPDLGQLQPGQAPQVKASDNKVPPAGVVQEIYDAVQAQHRGIRTGGPSKFVVCLRDHLRLTLASPAQRLDRQRDRNERHSRRTHAPHQLAVHCHQEMQQKGNQLHNTRWQETHA